jgi:hypothetical protein
MPNDNEQRVHFKDIDWKQMVLQRWGKEYTQPDPGYEFSNGRKFETPKDGGPYSDD